MAATSEGSSAVAGSNQLGLLSFSIMQPLDKMAAQIRAYREAWNSPDAKPISDVATNKVAAYTLVHCAETNQQARDNGVWESVAWWYQNIAQFTLDWELPHLDPAAQEASFPLLKPLMEGNIPIDSFDEGDMIVVGDPERCFEKMKHYADLGVDDLICYVQFGYHSGESTLKTIELLGKEVLPELEKYTPVDIGDNLAKFID
jgi:alkanesulfonate monooxygenase SsuD/methylene tetrahydromethanopterin reductase-like flavin-dependent oxidoreductase (luciferase family)